MPLIKIIRHGQLTLPADFRKALDVKDGDYLEAELQEDCVVLKPAVILDRAEAIKRLHRLMDQVQAKNEHISDEEVERDVAAAIRAVRRTKSHAKRRS
ncbi:AbrB/MazE/SpoVT family DNA-binding domain-containing protein [Candidatus Acetothermia bacterium]|nr:AbrB/MazE/SpoVT family DNA-binding domain-containing protein [Candidatus Acetothermia bacterium]